METQKTRVIQITDTHLFKDATGTLMGVNTRDSLNAVLQLIMAEYPDFECLLVTGDLTQDNSLASYEYLKEALAGLHKPFYWLCGNHDVPAIMHSVSPEAMVKQVSLGNWQVVLLNSQVTGSVHGHLTPFELGTLKDCLHEAPACHTLIALHHHPSPIHSSWMDSIALDNPAPLEQVIQQNQNVRCIIHGHVHQDCRYVFANTPVFSTPSTCIQFTPRSDDFQVEANLPGFRVLDLFSDGRVQTKVVRLETFSMEVDQAANGY